jgi:hypothetical protein
MRIDLLSVVDNELLAYKRVSTFGGLVMPPSCRGSLYMIPRHILWRWMARAGGVPDEISDGCLRVYPEIWGRAAGMTMLVSGRGEGFFATDDRLPNGGLWVKAFPEIDNRIYTVDFKHKEDIEWWCWRSRTR